MAEEQRVEGSAASELERRMLMQHGTKVFELKPSSILAAAEEDLRRHERNNTTAPSGDYEHYAFHRRHVAKTIKHVHPCGKTLIEMALGDLEIGAASGKHWTRVIYNDPELLKAALDG